MFPCRLIQRCACSLVVVLGVLSGGAMAQTGSFADAAAAAPRPEHVRIDYARVLKVEPVYETLRATTVKKVCEEVSVAAPQKAKPESGGWARAWDSVKGVFSSDDNAKSATTSVQHCRTVQVPRTFQRPIAFDVDYIYKGMKYRSRLPEDPGNRVQIRIAVQPVMAEQVASP